MNKGDRLKQLRKENKLTLKQLSKKSGVAVATISRMEANKMTGTLKAHTAICDALGLTLAEFISSTDSMIAKVELKKAEDIVMEKEDYLIRNLAKISKGKMKSALIALKPNSSLPEQKIGVDS